MARRRIVGWESVGLKGILFRDRVYLDVILRRLPLTTASRVVLVAVAALAPALCLAQARGNDRKATLAGVVRDSAGRPLSDVWVSMGGQPLSAFTNDTGGFELRGPAGRGQFTFRRLGMSVVTLDTTLIADSTVSIEVRMRPVPVLPDVNVSAEAWSPRLARDGYYDRQKVGWGFFLKPEDIAKMNVSYPSHLLRDVPFIRVVCTPETRRVTGGCIVRGSDNGCMTLFVDGVYTRMHLDERVSPGMVYTVEVYRRSSIVPMELPRPATENSCGAIVVWTQSRKP